MTAADEAPTEGADASDAPPGGESVFTVILAFSANIVIAIAKTIAAVITGSASMVAESAHSWADSGNEILLLIAEKRSVRAPDSRHPYGYGRDAYVWSMFAAFGLFAVGAAVSIQHGIQELFAPEPASDYLVAYIVLAVSFLFEGISFTQAYRQAHRAAQATGSRVLGQVLRSSNPTLRAVFAEDAAALIGLVIAFAGVLLHQLTGSPAWDAVGSILVGVLLAIVAIVLIQRNRRFLIGEAVPAPVRRQILERLLAGEQIERVTYLHIEFVGPGRIYLVAAVDLTGDVPESIVAMRLRAIEREIEKAREVAEAILTLSLPTDAALSPTDPTGTL